MEFIKKISNQMIGNFERVGSTWYDYALETITDYEQICTWDQKVHISN
jgi:hypothetical protein